MTHRRVCAISMVVIAWLLVPATASACAVCIGGEGTNMTAGLNNGILTLLAVVGVVQGGFVALFGSIWYRSRKLRKHRDQFYLIEGGR